MKNFMLENLQLIPLSLWVTDGSAVTSRYDCKDPFIVGATFFVQPDRSQHAQ